MELDIRSPMLYTLEMLRERLIEDMALPLNGQAKRLHTGSQEANDNTQRYGDGVVRRHG